jgi:hypothetical protein
MDEFLEFPFEEFLIAADPTMFDLDDADFVASLMGEDRAFAASDSPESDEADDWQWFCEHLETAHRLRPVSPREVAAHGIPPGATVLVTRGSNCLHVDVFRPI